MLASMQPNASDTAGRDQSAARSVKPIGLRRVQREHLHYLNTISANRLPLSLSWLSKDWRLKIHPIAEPVLTFAEHAVMDWGGAEVVLRIEPSLVDLALANVLQADSIGALTGELRELVIDAAFLDLSELVETRLRKRFRLVSLPDGASSKRLAPSDLTLNSGKQGWIVVFSEGATEFRCEAWLDDLAFGFLADAVRAWPISTSDTEFWKGLPLPVRFCVGWTTVTLGALRQLSLNDVILMDECLVNQSIEQIFVHVGTQYFFEAEILQSSIKVTDWIGKIMDDDDDFNDSINQTKNLEQDDADFDQIPVRLYFDLGERTITLAELKSIAPGYVFELGRELRRAVTIRVGGKKIGEGELVEIDGSIGVAVLAINSPLR